MRLLYHSIIRGATLVVIHWGDLEILIFGNIHLLTCFERGGAGNEHVEKFGGHSKDPHRETLGDKVKHLLQKDGHHEGKKREESPLQQETKAEEN